MTKQPDSPKNARQRLAANLRFLRSQQKLSQEGLADLVGLHRTYVGSVERSERNVSLDNVEKLATTLGVDITEILAESLPVGSQIN
jgi:transcriptional regulator with XRE-family HTH domain